jgi:hypothetical protein
MRKHIPHRRTTRDVTSRPHASWVLHQRKPTRAETGHLNARPRRPQAAYRNTSLDPALHAETQSRLKAEQWPKPSHHSTARHKTTSTFHKPSDIGCKSSGAKNLRNFQGGSGSLHVVSCIGRDQTPWKFRGFLCTYAISWVFAQIREFATNPSRGAR